MEALHTLVWPIKKTPWSSVFTCGKRRVSDLALVVGKLGKREDKSKDGVKKRRRRGT